MIGFLVEPFAIDTGLLVYYNADLLKYVITAAEIESEAHVDMRTVAMKEIMPLVAKLFPNSKLAVAIEATGVPVLKFSTSGAVIVAPLLVTVQIDDKEGQEKHKLIQMKFDAVIDAEVCCLLSY